MSWTVPVTGRAGTVSTMVIRIEVRHPMWVKDILAQWERGVSVGDACHNYEVELA